MKSHLRRVAIREVRNSVGQAWATGVLVVSPSVVRKQVALDGPTNCVQIRLGAEVDDRNPAGAEYKLGAESAVARRFGTARTAMYQSPRVGQSVMLNADRSVSSRCASCCDHGVDIGRAAN